MVELKIMRKVDCEASVRNVLAFMFVPCIYTGYTDCAFVMDRKVPSAGRLADNVINVDGPAGSTINVYLFHHDELAVSGPPPVIFATTPLNSAGPFTVSDEVSMVEAAIVETVRMVVLMVETTVLKRVGPLTVSAEVVIVEAVRVDVFTVEIQRVDNVAALPCRLLINVMVERMGASVGITRPDVLIISTRLLDTGTS